MFRYIKLYVNNYEIFIHRVYRGEWNYWKSNLSVIKKYQVCDFVINIQND